MDEEKLKPCPMCGSEKVIFESGNYLGFKEWIECYECGLRTDMFETDYAGRADNKAIAAWNRRAEPDSPPKCVYCDDSKRDAEGMRSFDAILVPTHCGQCGRKFDNE